MSQVKIQGNASGTGIFTIASPNSNNNQTLTLPDSTGTIATSTDLSNLNASNLTSGTVATARLASGTADSTTFLRGDQTWAAAGSTSNVQQFDSSGTWTKPTAGQTMARIQLWGGGGGGSRISSTNGTTAGGGGGYNEVTVPLSYLSSSVSITVGTGCAVAPSNNANGGVGGTSSLTLSTAVNGRTTIAAYGGGGGGNANTTWQPGAGGGQLSAGGTAGQPPGSPLIYTGTTSGDATEYLGAAGSFGGIWHGGGGSASTAPGGSSVFGGGGGSYSTGGTSLWGGNGGAGSGAGTAPGGGGGSSSAGNTNGGSGGAGRVIITCW